MILIEEVAGMGTKALADSLTVGAQAFCLHSRQWFKIVNPSAWKRIG